MGSARTPAKVAAARENGRLGGRPAQVYFDLNGHRLEEIADLASRLDRIVVEMFASRWPRPAVRPNQPWMRINLSRRRTRLTEWEDFILRCRAAVPEQIVLLNHPPGRGRVR